MNQTGPGCVKKSHLDLVAAYHSELDQTPTQYKITLRVCELLSKRAESREIVLKAAGTNLCNIEVEDESSITTLVALHGLRKIPFECVRSESSRLGASSSGVGQKAGDGYCKYARSPEASTRCDTHGRHYRNGLCLMILY